MLGIFYCCGLSLGSDSLGDVRTMTESRLTAKQRQWMTFWCLRVMCAKPPQI